MIFSLPFLMQSYLLFALVFLFLFCKNGQCNYGHSVIIINKLSACSKIYSPVLSSSSSFSLNLKQTCGASALQLIKTKKKSCPRALAISTLARARSILPSLPLHIKFCCARSNLLLFWFESVFCVCVKFI